MLGKSHCAAFAKQKFVLRADFCHTIPYGEERYREGTLTTDYGYTGQRSEGPSLGGLMDYNARWYDPYLNRFISPDTIVPDPANPQSFNRFAYVLNNPLRYVDPSGHYLADPDQKKVYTAGQWSDDDEEYFTGLGYEIIHGRPDSSIYNGDEYGDWERPLITRNNPYPSECYGLTFDQLPPRDQQVILKLDIDPAEWDRENLGNGVSAVRDLAMTSEDPILWVSVGVVGAVKYGPGVVQAGKEGLALAGMECMKNPLCASVILGVPTDGKIEIHSAHHSFPLIGNARHIQIMLWHPGVKGSHWIIRIPIP